MNRSQSAHLALALLIVGCHDTQGERSAADVPPALHPARPSMQPLSGELDAQIRQVAERAFESLGPAAGDWTLLTTPAIPARWPPNGELYVYVYGQAFARDLRDAELAADVWARVVITSSGLRVEKLAAEMVSLGIQVVMPVMRDEAKQHQAELKLRRQELLAATGLAGLDPRAFRQTYQRWQQWNGQIAKAIGARHPEFFDWAGLPR